MIETYEIVHKRTKESIGIYQLKKSTIENEFFLGFYNDYTHHFDYWDDEPSLKDKAHDQIEAYFENNFKIKKENFLHILIKDEDYEEVLEREYQKYHNYDLDDNNQQEDNLDEWETQEIYDTRTNKTVGVYEIKNWVKVNGV